jgi:GAF domain-containing protein
LTTSAPSGRGQSADVRAAFAELGRVSFEDTSMPALLRQVADLSKRVMPGVSEASITVVIGDQASTAAATAQLAQDLDELQYLHGDGPCLQAAVGQEIREITDARQEERWPDYARACAERGALSSLSMPVPVRENIQAALNMYAPKPDAFDDVAKETGREFASYVAVAVRNIHLYETTRERAMHLDAAMRSRAVIEQAKGILMCQRRCDASEAFSMLVAASQRSNRKLRDIAQSIVDGVSGAGTSRGRH